MPKELAWKLLELGQVIDLPKIAAIYAPLQENEPYQGVKIETRLIEMRTRPTAKCSTSSR